MREKIWNLYLQGLVITVLLSVGYINNFQTCIETGHKSLLAQCYAISLLKYIKAVVSIWSLIRQIATAPHNPCTCKQCIYPNSCAIQLKMEFLCDPFMYILQGLTSGDIAIYSSDTVHTPKATQLYWLPQTGVPCVYALWLLNARVNLVEALLLLCDVKRSPLHHPCVASYGLMRYPVATQLNILFPLSEGLACIPICCPSADTSYKTDLTQ